MTVYRPTITGGPAGDLLLARWAELIRIGYAIGGLEDLALHGTDEDRIELFAAFVAGAGKPNVELPDVEPDPDEVIYVYVGGDHHAGRQAAKRAARALGLDGWRWRHVTTAEEVEEHLCGFDATDLVLIELNPELPLDPTLDDALARYRTIEDIDTGGRL